MFAPTAFLRRTAEALAAELDAARLTGDEAVAVVRDLGMVCRLAQAVAGRAALRVEEEAAHRRCGDRTAADTVAKAFGVTTGEARRLRDTVEDAARFPATDAELRAGRLPVRDAHLVVETLAVDPGAERRLLSAARQGSRPLRDECVRVRAAAEDAEERARRQRRARSFRTWTDHDGMVAGAFRLPPEIGGPIVKWFDGAVEKVFGDRRSGEAQEPHEAYAADVFVALVRARQEADEDEAASEVIEVPSGGARRTRIPLGVNITAHVLIDHGALVRGEVLDGEVCEIAGVGPVSVDWVRSLLGEAFVTAVVKKGRDIKTVAHLGRHVPAEVQTALVVSGRECDIEGCHVRGYLERDHEHEFAKGGPTSWENLGWLCATHHRMKTGGWRLGPRDPVTRKRNLAPPGGDAERRIDAA